VKYAWSYTSTPPYVFIACYLAKHRDNFSFTLRMFITRDHNNYTCQVTAVTRKHNQSRGQVNTLNFPENYQNFKIFFTIQTSRFCN
jgi:hypothetical protein